jgi:hypothetical protein
MTAVDVEASKQSSVVGHFRVWKDVYDSLEEEARAHRTSLNTLVNQVLATHTRDDVIWEEMGYVRMTKIAYREVLKRVPDEKLDGLGPVFAKETPSAMMLARKGEVSLESVLDYLRFRSRSGWFSMNETVRNGRTTLSFMHDFGPRQSVVLHSYFVSLFGLVSIHPKVIATDSSVVVEF